MSVNHGIGDWDMSSDELEGEFARFQDFEDAEVAILGDEDWDEAADAFMAVHPEFLMDEFDDVF